MTKVNDWYVLFCAFGYLFLSTKCLSLPPNHLLDQTFQVYEGLDLAGGNRKAWGVRGSGGHQGGGDSTGGGDRGGGSRDSDGAGDGGGGGSYAEDEVRAAERLGISVREVSMTVGKT